MRTLINKTLLASASALSVLGLLLIMPQAVSAQEMETETPAAPTSTDIEATPTEPASTDIEATEVDTEMEASEMEVDTTDSMESGTIDAVDTNTTTNDALEVNDTTTDDMDSDVEASDDMDSTGTTPTYSNSPRALW
ncbi:MAG: hypothetical protein ACFB16_17820 [Phormidesmis sp.]